MQECKDELDCVDTTGRIYKLMVRCVSGSDWLRFPAANELLLRVTKSTDAFSRKGKLIKLVGINSRKMAAAYWAMIADLQDSIRRSLEVMT